MLVKQSPSHIKQNNLYLMLNILAAHESLSRADLVRLSHISKPTVSNLINELLTRNLVIEIGEGSSRTGRKPMLIKFNRTLKYFLAFDIGRGGYQAVVSDLSGQILARQSGGFTPPQKYRERVTLLHNGIVELLRKSDISAEDLLKIHGTAPGVYVEKGKEMKWFSSNGANEDDDMQQFLEREFQVPVILNHSTKLALLGEKIAGRAKGYSHVVYIDFAYGLGCAFMFNGSLYFGANRSAGEMGFVCSDLKEFDSYKIIPYGFGALEEIISGKVLREKGREVAGRYPDSQMLELVDGDLEKISAKLVFQAAMQGDPHAYSLLKESFRYLNMTLCNIINMLNPELIIFGGGISKTGDFMLDLITPEIKDKVVIMPEFAISELKDEASVIGAIAYLIEQTDFLTEL